MHPKILICTLLVCTSQLLQAQDVTGIWRGYFITETGDQYKLEFQLNKNSSTVRGVSYSYLDTRFYGKATMTGQYLLPGKELRIQELRTTEVRNLGGGGTCLMNYSFKFTKSGKEEFLEGSYLGKSEDRENPKNNGEWGDCGSGTVTLRRVQNSDFVLEPWLKPNTKSPDTKSPSNSTARNPQRTTTTPPRANPPRSTTSTPRRNTPPATRIETKDTVRREVETIEKPAVVQRPTVTLPAVTRSRENELVQTIIVNSDEVLVRLYDNGNIDDDTISVYLDGKAVITNRRLSASPISYSLKFEVEGEEHGLVMVAENLGRIPPNTSLMIVSDGDRRHQVSITATDQKNAMIRFRYKKP